LPAPFERRTFLGFVAAAAVAPFVPTSAADRIAHAAQAGRAARAAGTTDGVVRLGRAYLKAHPKDANVRRLRTEVAGLDPTKPVRDQLPAIGTASSAEFTLGTTVAVDGWLLSRSEARAAAAVALGA